MGDSSTMIACTWQATIMGVQLAEWKGNYTPTRIIIRSRKERLPYCHHTSEFGAFACIFNGVLAAVEGRVCIRRL
jgi:hypothetical protein